MRDANSRSTCELEVLSVRSAEARSVGALGDRLELGPVDRGAGSREGVRELVGVGGTAVDVLERVGEAGRENRARWSVVVDTGRRGGRRAVW